MRNKYATHVACFPDIWDLLWEGDGKNCFIGEGEVLETDQRTHDIRNKYATRKRKVPTYATHTQQIDNTYAESKQHVRRKYANTPHKLSYRSKGII